MSDENATADPRQYYIRARGRTMGPFTLERLRTMRSRGQLSRIHEISTDKQNWQSAANLDVLDASNDFRGGDTIDDQELRIQEESMPLQNDSGPPAPAGNKADWYYHVGGDMHGPVTLMELRALVSNRQVTSDDLVWKEGMADWLAVPDVPELRQSLTGSGPPSHASQSTSEYDIASGLNHSSSSRDVPLARTSGLAITGLALGVLGTTFSLLSGVALIKSSIAVVILASLALAFGFLSVFSIIFSAVAIKDINQARGTLTGKGIAVAGLVMGIVGTLVWAAWLLYLIDLTRLST